MAITQTKIPFAYGYCNIRLTDNQADPSFGEGYIFAVDTNSFVDIEEVKHEGMTIYNQRKKHTDEIHLSFDLVLREDNTLTSTSGYCDDDSIIRFLHFYPRQDNEDKAIYLSPAMTTSGNSFDRVSDVNTWKVIVDSIRLSNVVTDTRSKGQDLILSCRTVDPIKDSRWSMFFRLTSDDKFYIGVDSAGWINLGEAVEDNIYFSS